MSRVASLALLVGITQIAQQHVGAQTYDVKLNPVSQWSQCIDDGRLNIAWNVQGSGKLYSGLLLPSKMEACKPSKPTSCKWLVSCDATQTCQKFFPGEMSGRKKCLMVINHSNSTSRSATITLDLQDAGNWGAITFGIVATSLALISVVAAGCYSDLMKLAKGHKQKQPGQTSRRSTRARTNSLQQLPPGLEAMPEDKAAGGAARL